MGDSDGERLVDETGNPFAAGLQGEQAANLPRLLGGADLASDQKRTRCC